MARAPRKPRAKKATKDVAEQPANATFPAPEKVAASVAAVMGRPTKYSAAYCAVVVELGMEGKSRTQIACALGVYRETLNDWEKVHPEFKQAMALAIQYAQARWEELGFAGCTQGKDFNATAFIFQMKNRFGDDYSDTKKHTHSGSFNMEEYWARVPQLALQTPNYED